MKFKNIAFIVASFSVILVSCKKDDKSSPEPEPTPTPYTPVQGYDAEVYSLRDMIIGGGTSYKSDAAIFYGATTYAGVFAPSIMPGIVSINSTILKKDMSSVGPYYMDSTNALSGASYTLNVSGSSQFPAGSLIYGQNYPAFNDTMLVPSSVSLSSGISLQFNNCLNADSVSLQLQDAVGHFVTKKFVVTNNQANIILSPTELAIVSQTNNGSLWVDLVKKDLVTAGAKVYSVTLEKRYAKMSVQFN